MHSPVDLMEKKDGGGPIVDARKDTRVGLVPNMKYTVQVRVIEPCRIIFQVEDEDESGNIQELPTWPKSSGSSATIVSSSCVPGMTCPDFLRVKQALSP